MQIVQIMQGSEMERGAYGVLLNEMNEMNDF